MPLEEGAIIEGNQILFSTEPIRHPHGLAQAPGPIGSCYNN